MQDLDHAALRLMRMQDLDHSALRLMRMQDLYHAALRLMRMQDLDQHEADAYAGSRSAIQYTICRSAAAIQYTYSMRIRSTA